MKVCCDIDSLFFHTEDQVIQLVQHLEIQCERIPHIFVVPVSQPRVVMVNSDTVISAECEIIREPVHFFPGQVVRRTAKIDPVETDSLVRSIFKCQRTIRRRTDESVFSGGSVQKAGEVQRGTFREGSFVIEPLPLRIFPDFERFAVCGYKMDRLCGEGYAGDHPDRILRHDLKPE